MNYKHIFSQAIDRLHSEGRYRVFIDILRNKGAFPNARCFHGHNGPKPITVWCSNDYLAMGQHPKVVAAMEEALHDVGAGSGGTRNIGGNTHYHVDLEAELADLHGKEAALLFTSGTTGVPKAAELTHRNLRSNAQAGEVLFGTDSSNPDTYLAMLPLSHSFGQTVVQNTAVAFGATVVLMEHFEAGRALELLERHQVTLLAGVPTMYWSLCSAVTEEPVLASRTATLRMAVSGGASLPHQVHLDAQRLLGVTILEGYGLSETSPIASFSRLGYAPRVGSIGTPIPGVRMELLALDSWEVVTALDPDEVGEIAVCGPNVMRGYYRDPTATEAVLQDGWLRTGDVGRRDADGWFYVVDRASDVIIRGGYNVYPTEVEAVLWRHPDVDAVAVTGVPDDRLGEEIAAYVVLRPGADMAADDVVSWARERLPAYKYPRRVQFLPRLPVSPTGKVLKRALLRPVPVPAPRTSEAAAVGSDLTRAAGPEPSSSLAELRISEA